MLNIKLIIIILLSICSVKLLTAETVCGDWETVNNAKCFKLIETLLTYDEALKECIQYNSTLVTITSQSDQQIAENVLLNNNVIENVWSSLRYISGKYKWINNLEANYTNWLEGSPKNHSDYCVQLNSDESLFGKWIDSSCLKKNFALCENIPPIVRQNVLNLFIDRKSQIENAIKQQNNTILLLNNTKYQILNLNESLSFKFENISYIQDLILNDKFETILEEYGDSDIKTLINNRLMTNNKLLNMTKEINHLIRDLINELTYKQLEINNFVHSLNFSSFFENKTEKALIYPLKTGREISRTQAINLCHQNNATLVDIESERKQKIVFAYLYSFSDVSEYYWLGGVNDSNSFHWSNSGNRFNYTHWNEKEPKSDRPDTYFYSRDGFWYSTSAGDYNNAFCEQSFSFL